MAEYILKSAVVKELEKRRSGNSRNKLNLVAVFEDNYLLSFIDTLEVKEVEEYPKEYALNKGILLELKDLLSMIEE